ncbi:MAG: NAD(P)-dependent oxidoreductase [archaeon]
MLARGLGNYKWKHDELAGRTIGILGLGTVGKLLAEICLSMHMTVLHHSKSRKPEWEKKGVKFVDKKTLLTESDIICLQTPKNVKILEKEDFALMKEKILVNNTLGKAFDEQDFLAWIKDEGNYAIMDGAVEFGFKNVERVVFRDFVSGLTKEAGERLGKKVKGNLEGFLGGEWRLRESI